MDITRPYLHKKLEAARHKLQGRHIIAIDGSGDPDVEDLLGLVSRLIASQGRTTDDHRGKVL